MTDSGDCSSSDVRFGVASPTMGQIMPGGRPKEAPRTTVEVAGQADSGRKRRHSASAGEGDENSPENIQVKLDTPSK